MNIKELINVCDNPVNETPLFRACDAQYLSLIRYLLSFKCVEVNIKGHCGTHLLSTCIFMEYNESLKVLIEDKRTNINDQPYYTKNTYLQDAIEDGKFEGAKLLINNPRIKLNIKNKDGETALDTAEKHGTKEIVSMLKERGAKYGREL